MLSRATRLVNELHQQITAKDSKAIPDPQIEQKYQTARYQLVNEEKEPVETWEFRKKNFNDIPIIEDQALKCAEAMILSAYHIFDKEGMSAHKPELDQLMQTFKKKISELYQKAVNENDFYLNADSITHYLKYLMNDIALTYSRFYPNIDKLDDKEYAKLFNNFYKSLFHSVWDIDIPHFKNNILVLNKEAKTIQYYERGTQPTFIDEKSEEKGKVYIASHKRDAVGVPNFIAWSTGHLDENGKPVLTQSGFRHASLPPISLYKRKYHKTPIDCVDITTSNMQILGREMRAKVGEKPEKLNWINVSLLTVMADTDYQERQFRETILSADRIRSRDDATILPITFDFGVNIFATSKSPITALPNIQIIENHRALFQLHKLLVNTVNKTDRQVASVFVGFDKIATQFEEKIEQPILAAAKTYDQIFQAYSALQNNYNAASEIAKSQPTTDNINRANELKHQLEQSLNQLKDAEIALNNKKSEVFDTANALMADYYKQFTATNKVFIEKALELLKSDPESQSLCNVLEDLKIIIDLYQNKDNKWNDVKNNFKIQAYIVDIASNLEQLGAYVTSSWNCKSNNDRSALMAWFVNAIAERRRNPNINNVLQSHYQGSAWVKATEADTLAGGPKFGAQLLAKFIRVHYGHPLPELARMHETTAHWAMHIFEKKAHTFSIPYEFKLMSAQDLMQERRKSVTDLQSYYGELLSELTTILDAQESSTSNNIIKSFFANDIKNYILTPTNQDGSFKKYIIAEIIDEYLKKIYQHPHIDIASRRVAMTTIQQLLDHMQGSTLLFSSQLAMPDTSHGAEEKSSSSLEIFPLDQWEKTLKKNREIKVSIPFLKNSIGLGLEKSNSKFTKIVTNAYKEYLNSLQSTSSGLESLRDQYSLLINLNTAIENWLLKKRGKEGANRSDDRLSAMQLLHEFAQKQLSYYEKYMQSITTQFLSGKTDAAMQSITTFKQSSLPSPQQTIDHLQSDSEPGSEDDLDHELDSSSTDVNLHQTTSSSLKAK